MLKVHSKVVKLIRALKQYDKIYIVSKHQFYSEKIGKVLSIVKLRKIMNVAEYKFLINPNYKGNKTILDVELYSSFSEIEILKKLAIIYAEVKEHDKSIK